MQRLYFWAMDEKRNPWTVLAEREVYSNPWIGVTEFNVLNPKGGKGIYGKVHFRNWAIGILPLDDELNTYLVGQYRFPIGQYSWEIPEGGGPLGVDILHSAQRELKEETGLIAAEWVKLQEMHLSNSVSDEAAVLFLARKLKQETAAPEDTEELVVKKTPFSEAYRMTVQGEITDAMTVAAILKVHILLLEGKFK